MSGSLPTPVAKYRQLLALLRDEIRAGVYQPGQAFPSQNALSERYGVSVTTVREALSVLAHQGLITRINGKGSFVNKVPSEATVPTQHILGLITFNVAHPYYSEVIRRVEQTARQRGFSLLLSSQSLTADEKRADLDRMRRHQAQGIILGPIAGQEELDEVLRGEPAPHNLVVFDCGEPVSAHCFATDQTVGTMEAVEHLVSLGHQRIWLITAEDRRWCWGRRRGFELAVERFGLDPTLCRVIFRGGAGHRDVAYATMRQLLNGPELPTALLAHCDVAAFGILRALNEAGLSVPDDMSVVGFDDIETAAYAQVPLTTVDRQLRDIGEHTVHLLQQALDGGPGVPYRQVVVPSRLVIRGSTSRPR